ncbi:hypothetical protein PUT78_05820 [Roseinatronobacter sp. HJB301]|uniref:Uncharacterized protein n=1 Tax=Roseinatronobacter alkalisoli TaxID=3028235 RepID=A0ABT5T6P0_9RHOB|nr:hypothetical protein [Roseinatronobacter sp. HJB301]MDD7970609.1 hypothetical protein [Roseinatronobacter sp. HJB301]
MWFSGGAKTVGEDLQDWIVIAGDECGLEHHMPQQAPSTCNGALAAHSATVLCDGRKASECCDLFPRDLAKLGHFGNQHGAGDRADPSDRPQNVRSRGKLFIQGDSLSAIALAATVMFWL